MAHYENGYPKSNPWKIAVVRTIQLPEDFGLHWMYGKQKVPKHGAGRLHLHLLTSEVIDIQEVDLTWQFTRALTLATTLKRRSLCDSSQSDEHGRYSATEYERPWALSPLLVLSLRTVLSSTTSFWDELPFIDVGYFCSVHGN